MPITLIYDGRCSLCVGSMRLVRRLDWLQRITYLDARDWPTVQTRYPELEQAAALRRMHVITSSGRVLTGFVGARHLCGRLPALIGLYPLLYLPGVAWLGPRLYDWVARHRYQINYWLGRPMVYDDDPGDRHGV